MLQRLRGAIDNRIAEEQARQRAALHSTPQSETVASSSGGDTNGNSHPSKISPPSANADLPITEGSPDPSEFDAPLPVEAESVQDVTSTGSPAPHDADGLDGKSGEDQSIAGVPKLARPSADRPESLATQRTEDFTPEVRVKLRKLSRLEGRYQELLKAYRVAHAKVQTIEPFEASLRENTPLTTIEDPSALLEYLNQITRKSEMVLAEFKSAATERDDYRKKSDQSGRENLALKEEVLNLRQQGFKLDTSREDPADPIQRGENSAEGDTSDTVIDRQSAEIKSPTPSAASRISTFGLFSGKSKATTSPQEEKETGEDFFSYDTELPRLQDEVHERDSTIVDLRRQISNLQKDLLVARESTEGMVSTLEITTEELQTLREAKGQYEVAETKSKDTVDRLERERSSLTSDNVALRTEDQRLQSQVAKLQETLSQTNTVITTLEASQEEAKEFRDEAIGNQEKLESLERTLEALRSQLQKAVEELTQLREAEKQAKLEVERLRTLNSADSKKEIRPAHEDTKKKNKKKRKNKSGQGSISQQHTSQSAVELTEAPDRVQSQGSKPKTPQEIRAGQLEEQIKDLRNELVEKDEALSRLSAKLKDQEILQEEIEGLRDDLLHQGDGHVEARKALNAVSLEKAGLEERMVGVQKELDEAKAESAAGSSESTKTHEQLLADFGDLKTKFSSLEKDLAVSQQLAAARFKDITDLRDVLSKTQPELRSLRSEMEDSRSTKQQLKDKVGKVVELESKCDDQKAEVERLQRKHGEDEAKVAALQRKLSDSNSATSKANEDARTAQSDLSVAQAARQEAMELRKTTSAELSKLKAAYSSSQIKTEGLMETISKHDKEIQDLREEVTLKSSLHESSQAIMSGLREQTLELSTQAREAISRSESLEEELVEAQRMLSERSRECETMRLLVADLEGRTSIKVRDMKERMETAIEERDRVEEETSTSNRRMAREVDDLRNKAREATRTLKTVELEREDLERSQRELSRSRDQISASEGRAREEMANTQDALRQLREALTQREREVMELEQQRSETKQTLEERQESLDRLQKSNKGLMDEIKAIQQNFHRGAVTSSTRSSMESSHPPGRNNRNPVASSPAPSARIQAVGGRSSPTIVNPGVGTAVSDIDYVYLKNVLLQFLEQRDKTYQKQLIPVLRTLLHFDQQDEQKWTAAISAR